ncbi:MAG TPA: hydrogenase expression/formation protein HypE [Caldithrix abyssi]|uniref:Hydrogenase expression/formation protein HypE n=1 Tax=Caldithrix abyssi TaxID=187145 RepID=A0A7V4U4A8_CALAY|nr:hydrogenase expression/formation protein HypE [Caldithrix abyssi]
MSQITIDSFSCPLPIMDYDTIQLAHGAGGKLSAELIDKVFMPCFGNQILDKMEDQAVLERPEGRLAFTTDSFVVSPVFFPGGNIGELAVNGTVNDICMSGATPLYLSVGFILEEGLPIEELHRIVVSMKAAAEQAGVRIVTGDTKVVNKGSCDKLFINTSGVGVIPEGLEISSRRIRPGDKILLSGTIADHGMAVMTVREGLSFQSAIESDTAALNGMVAAMLETGGQIHAMRDPTRGGVATTLNEWAKTTHLGIRIQQNRLPVRDDVRGACEILGIDPLYVANEGKLLAVAAPEDAEKILLAMRQHPLGKDAVIFGEVVEDHPGKVTMMNPLGVERIIDMPVGEQLPRIC